MKKTIAVITSGRNGVSFHRQITPHAHLENFYPGEFEILIKDSVSQITDEEYQRIKLIHFCGIFDFQKEDVFRRKGIVTVLDKDDYWQLPKTNPYHYEWEMRKMWYKTEMSVISADHIICTTNYLADKIRELNHNVTVIPNSINPRMKMYQPKEWVVNPDFVRFGGLWGLTHVEDLKLMGESFSKISKQKDIRKKCQFICGGFSMGETETNVMAVKNGMMQKQRIPLYETIWGRMERVMTENYRLLFGQHEYLKYLAQYKQVEVEQMEGKIYKRIWGRDLFSYCEGYNEMDVALAPLLDNEFNRCKSQIKIIEAGYFGRTLIASDIEPYRIDGVNGKNCFLVKESRTNDFYVYMRKLILNPEMIKDMGAALKEVVTQRYMMDKVNEIRKDLYNYLIDKKNKA